MQDNAWGSVFQQGGPAAQVPPFPSLAHSPTARLRGTNFYATCVPNQLRAILSTNTSLSSFTNWEQTPCSPLNFDIDHLVTFRQPLIVQNPFTSLSTSRWVICQPNSMQLSTRQNQVLRVEVRARQIAQHKEEFPKSQRYFKFKQRLEAQSTGYQKGDLCIRLSQTRSSLRILKIATYHKSRTLVVCLMNAKSSQM